MSAQIITNLVDWTILGLLAGLITSFLSEEHGDFSLWSLDLLLGILGSILAGSVMNFLFNLNRLTLTSNILALTGAFLLLIVAKALIPTPKTKAIPQVLTPINGPDEVYALQITPHPNTIQKYLAEIQFPVSKRDLLRFSEQQGASRESLELLERLPDHIYENPVEINRALLRTID